MTNCSITFYIYEIFFQLILLFNNLNNIHLIIIFMNTNVSYYYHSYLISPSYWTSPCIYIFSIELISFISTFLSPNRNELGPDKGKTENDQKDAQISVAPVDRCQFRVHWVVLVSYCGQNYCLQWEGDSEILKGTCAIRVQSMVDASPLIYESLAVLGLNWHGLVTLGERQMNESVLNWFNY
jgi:hypothetical protein